MEELESLKRRLETERPVEWENFPDIGLYKDQIVAYLKRQLINTESDGQLTPAMISNYVKDKLLPKADGKKYNREHMALLTEISLLKQVLPVKDIGYLITAETESNSIESFYGNFTEVLDKTLSGIAKKLETDPDEKQIIDMALGFAVESYCSKLICEKLIEIIRMRESEFFN